jgi:hypothetical protein
MKIYEMTSIPQIIKAAKTAGSLYPGSTTLYYYDFDDGGRVIFDTDLANRIENEVILQDYFSRNFEKVRYEMLRSFAAKRSYHLFG